MRPHTENEEVRAYLPLVHRMAGALKKHVPESVSLDELVSAGMYGLLVVLRRTKQRSAQFDSYAAIALRWAMLDWCRGLRFVPRKHWARGIRVTSLEHLSDRARGMWADADDVYGSADARLLVEPAVADLSEREAMVLQWLYVQDMTGTEVAEILGVSEARVSQIHTRALAAMRRRLAVSKG